MPRARAILAALGLTIDYWYDKNRGAPGVDVSQTDRWRVTSVFVHEVDEKHWDRVIPGTEHHVIVRVAAAGSPLFHDTVWAGFAPALASGDPATAGC